MDAVYVAGVQRCKSQEVSMSAPCYPCPRPDIRWCQVSPRVMPVTVTRAPTNGITSTLPSSPSAPSINSALSVNYSCFKVPREGPYKVLSAEIITDRRFG